MKSSTFPQQHSVTGSHGEASRSETEVPLVTWGSGILGPKQIRNSQSPISWNLNHLERLDVNQNDLAPLMSVLLGIPIPVNSLVSVSNLDDDLVFSFSIYVAFFRGPFLRIF